MKPRTLKIESVFDWKANVIRKSKLRLQGIWLRRAGFEPGGRALIEIIKGQLIIKPLGGI